MKKNITLLFKNIRCILTEKLKIITLDSKIMTLGSTTLVILGSVFMIPIVAFMSSNASSLSYQNSVDLSFTFNPTISVNVSGDLVIDNLSPGNASDSNIITVTTASNSIAGYDLKATVGSSTNAYTDLRLSSSDTTNKFTALSSNKATLNAFDNDTWGYSYSTDSGTTWVSGNVGSTTTGYNGLPQYNNTGTLLINTTTPTSSSIQFKIGAKASNTKVSGDYTNTINFLATSKVLTTHYSLTYNKNTNEEVLGMPSNISDTYTIDSSITLSSATPERAGYNFTGWCSVDNSADPTTCSGTIYQPGGTVLLTVGQGNTITLYGMWESAITTLYMQNVATWGSNLTAGQEVTATDNRDGKEYTVARLADGNIWMTQNLDHDIVSTTDFYTYDNTDIGHGSTPNTNATWTGTATYATGTTTWNGSRIAPESYDPGDVCWLGEGEYDYDDTCADTHYHLGNYYNWTAAVAMTNSSSYTSGTDVDQSICPAGWMLPKGGSNTGSGSFYNLVSQYGWSNDSYMMEGSYSMWSDPLYFPLSGYWDGNLGDIGNFGDFWSSVVSDSRVAYCLDFDGDGDVTPDVSLNRSVGFSVRCVARAS